MNEHPRTRRANLTTAEVEEMRAKEQGGMTRKQIADEKGIAPSVVTRHLGAVRKYGHLRAEEPEVS
jgi:DNA-binding CsgD family transcriptional regulator